MVATFLDDADTSRATVLTSRFHIERCAMIFSCIAPRHSFLFICAPDPSDIDPALITHERSSLAAMRARGGIDYNGRHYPIPASC